MFAPNYATYGFKNGPWSTFKGLFTVAIKFNVGGKPNYSIKYLPTVSVGFISCFLNTLLQITFVNDSEY